MKTNQACVWAGVVSMAISAAAIVSTAAAVELRQVSRLQNVQGTDVAGWMTPTWSRDGHTIAAVALSHDVDTYMFLAGFDLSGNLVDWPRRVGDWNVNRPSLDPTQAHVAIGCFINLTCHGLAVVETAPGSTGYPECLLIQNRQSHPAWSPDGQSIVVETDAGLQAVAPTGGTPQPVTTRGDDETPAWSPDGTKLVFSSTLGGNRDLWIKDMASGALRQLTDDAPADTWPAWSPDGRWIAFASSRGASFGIWAMSAAGGSIVAIADLAADDSAPAWSPDGGSIAFESSFQIWVATGVADVLVAVNPASWSGVKMLYRDASR